MIIKATDEQVIKMAKLAILASRPVGMGFLGFNSNLKEEDITDLKLETGWSSGLYIDYYQGRMVKFASNKVENGYAFPNGISPEYQSWISTYPSYLALFEAACK